MCHAIHMSNNTSAIQEMAHLDGATRVESDRAHNPAGAMRCPDNLQLDLDAIIGAALHDSLADGPSFRRT